MKPRVLEFGFFLFLLLIMPLLGTSNDQVLGLLSFKKLSIHSDPQNLLSNWVSNSNSTSPNPCSWYGVSCSSYNLVTSLNLTNSGLIGTLHLPQLVGSLQSLKHLNLHGNSFSAGDLSASSGACSLESLDLSSNNFSDPLPPKSFFSDCYNLAYVNLSHNFIPGATANLKFGPSLLQLDLSVNRISDSVFLNRTFSICQNLVYLNFSDNKLAGKLESTLIYCKSISVVDLSYNLFSGDIPYRFVVDSPPSLKHLDLSHNNFSGSFTAFNFGQCSNLTFLSLSQNRISGEGFPSSLGNCNLLETLDLSHNELQLKIPGALIGGMRSLRGLSLAANNFSGSIPPELGEVCGTLQELDLSSNKLTGALPASFLPCSSLQRLNLGNNLLSGDFLTSVISNLQNLKYLYVSFNNLTGPLPLSLVNLTHLQVLDLSSNQFTGNVPFRLCSSDLQQLLVANNYLSGEVPSELGMCKNLRRIDLSFNNLNGPIPSEVWTLPNLADLVMWANNLTGEIPEGICTKGGNLETLILNNNLLTGSLPKSIGSCTNMIWISLSSNQMSGEIPLSIGNLDKLAILQMGNNSLSGKIPPELGKCRSLIWLDLNSNDFVGVLPPELADQSGLIVPGIVSGKQFAFVRNEGGTSCRGAGGLVELEGIRAERLENFPMVHSCPTTRIYSGKTVYTFNTNGSMIYLDLSYNSLSGIIPKDFGSMSYLQVLNLGHNKLTGIIPDSFGGLKEIGVLDLSHNDLQGFVPSALGTLSFLSDLDVSNNNLSGPIPSGGQLTTFPASRYENNSGLCGVPLAPCGSGGRSPRSSTKEKKQSLAAGMVIGLSFFVLCFLVLTLALYRVKKLQKKEEQREKYIESLPTSGSSSWKQLSGYPEPLSINVATFEKPLRKLTFADLLEATNGFSADSLIGTGGFGEVYKAQLRDGCVVAIKKLIHITGQGDREFMAEMETIGKIKHRNLVPLLGYCKVGEERLLVYEYMKWGSLESVLHDISNSKGGCLRPDWQARKRIAIGSARGLAFLHHSCIPHIIHRDMKSSNVLIDENFEARVSDFGMARLVNALDTHLSVSTLAGTPGYVPPEYYQSFRCTTKGDVYSYGVILLELVSGKKPIDPTQFGDDNNLVGWAKQLHRDKRISDIIDPQLTEQKSYETELLQYLRIAFECLDDRPFKRPTMIQVMAMFKELQADSENDILDGLSLKDASMDEMREKESSS